MLRTFLKITVLIHVGVVCWIYNDAEKRWKSGTRWAIAAFLLPGISLLVYAVLMGSKTAWVIIGFLLAWFLVMWVVFIVMTGYGQNVSSFL